MHVCAQTWQNNNMCYNIMRGPCHGSAWMRHAGWGKGGPEKPVVQIPVVTGPCYKRRGLVKFGRAIPAGAATAFHSIGRTKLAIALGGASGLLASLGAMFLGLLLQTGQG